MNKTYVTKEIISRVVDRLYQQGERIEVGGNRHTYKRKYHLKYSQIIVRNVLNAFLEEIAVVLSEGDAVKITGYFRLEPKLYKRWEQKFKLCEEKQTVPDQYKPKVKLYKRLKDACKSLVKENNKMNEEEL